MSPLAALRPGITSAGMGKMTRRSVRTVFLGASPQAHVCIHPQAADGLRESGVVVTSEENSKTNVCMHAWCVHAETLVWPLRAGERESCEEWACRCSDLLRRRMRCTLAFTLGSGCVLDFVLVIFYNTHTDFWFLCCGLCFRGLDSHRQSPFCAISSTWRHWVAGNTARCTSV